MRLLLLAAAAAVTLSAGCAARIASHGDTIAEGLNELQVSQASFFDALERNAGTVEAEWPSNIAWYEQTSAAIDALRARAASRGSASDATVKALDLLQESINELEEAHAGGFSAMEIPILRTLFDSQLRMLIELEAAKKRNPAAEVSL